MNYLEQYQSSIVKIIDPNTFSLHPALLSLWQELHSQGMGLFVVGGAIRDLLVGVQPYEYDFATELPLMDIIERATAWGFKITITSGDLEVVTLRIDDQCYEVARLRVEKDYEDRRHPEQVTFTSHLQLDSERRDFTVNGFYMDFLGVVYDFHQGYQDLMDGMLKSIGDPKLKMSQDALRLLRGIRIATKLELKIDHELLAAMQSLAYALTYVSMERRMEELRGILSQPNWHRGLSLMESCGFMRCGYYLSPVLPHLKTSTQPHSFIAVFAMLLVLQSFDWNDTISERLDHYALSREEKTQLRKYMWSYSHVKDPLEILFKQGEHYSSLILFFEGFKSPEIHELIAFLKQCEAQGLPMSAGELSISPKRLLELGVEGSQINAVLYDLFLGVHKGFYLNSVFSLEEAVKRGFNH